MVEIQEDSKKNARLKAMKELKRLHENIVKDDKPLPSKRSCAKRTSNDFIEEVPIKKQRKSDVSDISENFSSPPPQRRKSLPDPKQPKVVKPLKVDELKRLFEINPIQKKDKSKEIITHVPLKKVFKPKPEFVEPVQKKVIEKKITTRITDGQKIVENMGYQIEWRCAGKSTKATTDAFTFNCLVEECEFFTNDNDTFLDHLETNHLNVKWSGECTICSRRVTDKARSIIFELMHMRENHVLNEKQKANESDDEEIVKNVVEKSPPSVSNREVQPEKKISEGLVGRVIKIGQISNQLKQLFHPQAKKSSNVENINAPCTSSSLASSYSDNNNDNASKTPVSEPNDTAKIKKHVILKPTNSNDEIEVASSSLSLNKPEPKLSNDTNESFLSNDTFNDILRPWTKRQTVKKHLVPATRFLNDVASLIASFKCMSAKCSFYTSDQKLFETHLKLHMNFVPSNRDFINCPFCDHKFTEYDTIQSCIAHINTEHGGDNFQCAYCFYRSYAICNVVSHQRIFHNTKSRAIYQLKHDKIRNYAKEFESTVKMINNFVPALKCFLCSEFFYIFHDLKTHLQLSHKANHVTKCSKCLEICYPSQFTEHLITCYGMGIYQCLYCCFGKNSFQMIVDHMSNCHSSKIPIFCERTSEAARSHDSLACAEITSIKAINQKVDSRIILDYDIPFHVLRNANQTALLNGNIRIQRAGTSSYEKVKVSNEQHNQELISKNTKKCGLQIENVFSLNEKN